MEDKKDIQKIAEQLFSEEQAREFAENLQNADRLFEENPVPEPDVGFVDELRAQVSNSLRQRRIKHRVHKTIFRAVSAAAVFIVAAVILTNFSQTPNQQVPLNGAKESSVSLLPDKIWQSSNLAEDDPELSNLNFELRQLQSELAADDTEEESSENAYQEEASEIEASLLAINNEFWKGR